ncbi:MAG: hypothetical protein U9Q83_03345, partial [Bacteroidota bacterium]|nr:hypothetical protein [Bacteroidota bacterium]
PTLKCYLSKNNFDFSNFDITSAKNKFSETVVNNQRYKFTTRSFSFELGIEQYTYKGKTRKIEVELGEKLFKSGKLKELLKLDFIPHQQEKRKYKKYQNVDFEGFRIIKQISSDEIEIINVELKPSNKIEYVSDAISQAVNYKESANKTYIAIPLFDPKSFYDADRFQNFIRLCEENELGIISININPESHEILGLDIILNAKKRELVRHDRANELLEQDGKIYCPLCHRIVSNDNNRTRCGWSVEIGDNTKCMKQIMENSMINQKLNNEQEK